MADLILKSAQITFSLPKGDDKDTDTAVSVEVTTKYKKKYKLSIARKLNFANNDTWEDTGDKSYTYDLNHSSIKLEMIDDITVHIQIHPNGNDTVKFGYKLLLVFDDGEGGVLPIPIDEDNITLSQNNRDHYYTE